MHALRASLRRLSNSGCTRTRTGARRSQSEAPLAPASGAGPRRVSQQIQASQGKGSTKSETSGGVSLQSLLFATLFTFIGGVAQQCYANPTGDVARMYKEARDGFCKNVLGIDVDEIFLPASVAIPVWPTDPAYAQAQIPPGTPAPILLVLDVEKTCVGSVHDHKYGWRYVKRPGLDKFIKSLARGYFEVVLFSETELDEKVLMAIDPDNVCHKLNASHGEVRNGQVCKRLDLMNRDVRKIILIDDNPNAAQLFPENTLLVTPFEDVKNKNDSELTDLIPLLQSLVHQNVDDVRQTFKTLLPFDSGKHSAHEAAVEYAKRISEYHEAEQARRHRGLGSLLRGGSKQSLTSAVVRDNHIPSALDLINASDEDLSMIEGPSKDSKSKAKMLEEIDNKRPDPNGVKLTAFKPSTGPVNKKKGKLLSWVEDAEKEKAEQEMRKQEKMQELFLKKQMEQSQKQNN